MTSKNELPDISVLDLHQIYVGAVNEVVACEKNDLLVFDKHFKSLASYIMHKNLKTSMNAFYFILKLQNLTTPGSKRYYQIFDLLIRRCGSSSHSGPILDGILTTITNHFVEATQTESPDDEVVSCFCAISERLQEFIIHLNPNSGFHFLNHFQSLDPTVLKNLYGNILVKIVFEEINLTKFQCLDFWDVLKKDNTLTFMLLLWIKENDFPKLIHVYSLLPNDEIFNNFSVLFLSNLFVQLSLHGINKDNVFHQLLAKVVKADELIQSIVCMLLALNLKDCPCSMSLKYLTLCTELINNKAVCKQAAQFLKVQLIFFCRDNIYFPDFQSPITLLNNAIENHVGNAVDVSTPIICDLSLQFIIRRYQGLTRSVEILRLMEVFHITPSSILPWVDHYVSVGYMIPKLERDAENDYYFSHKSERKAVVPEEKIFSENSNNTCIAILNYVMFYEDMYSDFALNAILKTEKKDLCVAWLRFFLEDRPDVQNSILSKIGSTKDHKGGDDFRMKLFRDIKESPLNAQVGVVENVYLRLKSVDNVRIDETLNTNNCKEYVIGYLMMLNRAINLNCNFNCQQFLIHLNFLMNKWVSQPCAAYVVSLIMDCLKSFCKRNRLIVLPICGEIVRIAIHVNSDCVFKSLCRFLSLVPDKVYLKTFRIQDFAVVSKSVYVLWKLTVFDTPASKDAAEALAFFNLEYFDGALLSCCGHNVDPTSEEYHSPNSKISECCWLHLLMEIRREYCIPLFTKLIEKGTANTPRHENYSCLQRAIVMYLKEAMDDDFDYFNPENEPLTDICLHLLCIKWERSTLDFSFMYNFFLKCANYVEYQNKVLLMLILNSETYSAKETFNKLVNEDLIKPHHTKTLYLLDKNQLKDAWFLIFKHSNSPALKTCICNGLIEAFKEGHLVEDSKIIFVLRNPQVSFCVKHSIICHLLKIWEKSHKGKFFTLACSVLSRCDMDFIRSLPIDKMDSRLYKKYMEVVTLKAIHSKLLSDFVGCFDIAIKNPSLKYAILLNLIKFLKRIGTVNLSENKIWLSQFVLKRAQNLSNFDASVLALCFDALTGSMLLSADLNLYSAIDHLPISFSAFYKSKEPSVLKMICNWMANKKLKPVFREAFKATAMILCDSIPNVQYSSYVKIYKN